MTYEHEAVYCLMVSEMFFLRCRSLSGLPLCVVANKVDLEPHLSEEELIRGTAEQIPIIFFCCFL